jgi:ribosome-associated protein
LHLPKEANPALGTLEGRIGRIAGIIDEMKGEKIVVMDLRGISDFADAFVIATVRSSTHMQAITGALEEKLRAEGLRPLNRREAVSTRWALLDYADVIVHLFEAEARAYYDLERLWGDAESIPWPRAAMA